MKRRSNLPLKDRERFFLIPYLIYLLLRFFSFLINLLPEAVALWIGRWLGKAMYYLDMEHRKVASQNLDLAFGQEKSKEELRNIAKKSFENLGMMAMEFFRIPNLNIQTFQKKVKVEGLERALKVLDENRGALLLLGHFGNWELMALMSKVIGRPIVVIAKPIKRNPWLYQWILKSRERIGLIVIPPRNATPKVLQALSENQIVGVLFDQRGKRSQGIWADFFGRKVPTTPGLAVMALRSKAPVIPVFMVREGQGRHHLFIKEPLKLIHTGDFRKDVEANTQLFNHVIESIVRQYPEQWLWIHRRWERKRRH
jgi:KDO2-lipid IV(A) lauroyltransferase